MRTGTLLNRTSLMFVGGLIVLAGVFSDGHRASAQTQEACPLPAGGTPVAPPGVTAQQVENGTGSLMEFVLEARERSVEHARQATTAEQGLYIACLVREEGGPWRSGSTYVVSLTLDGRVYLHAKDMSLAGRLLNPFIYGEILSALGVSPADLANLGSPDPDTRNSAFAAVIATLSQEPDAPFDATVPIPGLRPGIPGASGYAAVYVSPELRSPIVLLAGFDINESHFAQEDIDYGDPAITARDVVDRETLKAFVTEAGEYFLGLQQSGDPAAWSKARIALRDPNGPWRHGSVYLYVLDLNSDLIVFHAAFPDRFEYRPLVPTVHDAVTGKLVLPQVIEAATSGPEGGFVEYYFDDPEDHSDSADIPKVGYAREFKADIVRSDGITVSLDLVIGSGFYPSSPSVAAARQNTVVKSVLPQVMRAMTASTVDAVSGRIQQAASGAPPAKGFSLGGASTLSDALLTHGRALANDSFDPDRLLQGSSFTLPLNAAARGRGGLLGNLTFWGSGDYRNFSGGNLKTVDYDGNVVSANLGIDTRVGENLLAGVSAGWARGTVDYTDSNAVTGELATTVTSVNPYVGVQTQGGMNLWATGGYGWGEVEVDDELAGAEASDLTQRMVAAGVRGPLVSSDELLKGGTTSLSLKGETAFTWADVDGSGALESMKLEASRHRLMLEGSHVRKLDSGATFTPSIEVGMRYDGGDGETGSSIETGGGLRYADSGSGLTIEGRARTLFAHSGDYEEWGVSGLLRLDPGAAGLGFSLSVRPAWGRTASGARRMWESGVLPGLAASDQAARVNARVGYGFGTTWGGRGVVTPYTGVSLSGEGSRRFSLGGQYRMGSSVTMSLEGVHSDPAHRATSQGVMLRADINW
ncbi:MAG: autotransporter domain-containing protein [Deltaproteobacteria bacterium]|nr:autotransporter domain-containing protein [Deltaproteobacteria bacterium]